MNLVARVRIYEVIGRIEKVKEVLNTVKIRKLQYFGYMVREVSRIQQLTIQGNYRVGHHEYFHMYFHVAAPSSWGTLS